MTRPVKFCLSGIILAGLASSPAVAAGATGREAPVLLAQASGFGVPDGAVEVYVDQYGQRVFLDSRGRVVGVEQPRRGGFQRRRDRFRERRGEIIDAPPPPGLTVEGRVDVSPQGGFDQGPDYGRPQTIDPYSQPDDRGYDDRDYGSSDYGDRRYDDQGPVEASPLPPAGGTDPDLQMEAGIPQPSPDEALPGVEGPATGTLGDQPLSSGEGQTIEETNPAPAVEAPGGKADKAQVAALQILLDRAGMSPGVIDGRMGGNVNKAVAAYREKFGKTLKTGDPQVLAEDLDATGGPPIIQYEITNEDVAGPYVASIPSDYGEKAKLPAMSFERVTERLAERFHMDEDYLKAINPGADFNRPGTKIKVANVGANATGEVTKIIADKGREQVRAYGADGTLIAAYPATIGSTDTPSPSGTVRVDRIAFNPNYTYNPKINFKQGGNDKVLTIPPGPNGPVGTIWIALSKPTYGIHGTPEPSKIGKTNSHGCVRLTNWDATELAKMVKPGVTVEFVE
ncbi:L,D-transpeptidase family protein [Jiella mangrovi]|uniref:L,D-transpeptidase family protein n=1 Tax=Jiella mangrovi TaxID=2821407 RepID=A0ABS4BPA6_9HYPH|nr:L,D-transpeptidase family protein [Jiella mangrovi]MBP0617960.1 L,D-transpeptidase family protein [Jiella mangrovi]